MIVVCVAVVVGVITAAAINKKKGKRGCAGCTGCCSACKGCSYNETKREKAYSKQKTDL